jgi:hypothetical protein
MWSHRVQLCALMLRLSPSLLATREAAQRPDPCQPSRFPHPVSWSVYVPLTLVNGLWLRAPRRSTPRSGHGEVGAREVHLIRSARELGPLRLARARFVLSSRASLRSASLRLARRKSRPAGTRPTGPDGELRVRQGPFAEPVQHKQGVGLDGVGRRRRSQDAGGPVAG